MNAEARQLFEYLDAEVFSAIVNLKRPKGGQQAGTFHGDFAGCPLSALLRLRKHLEHLRAAVEKGTP